MSFETQSFQPKKKKVIKTVKTAWREPLFFLPEEVIDGVKCPHKKITVKRNVCARQTSFSALFLLNKIAVPKFINNPHSK